MVNDPPKWKDWNSSSNFMKKNRQIIDPEVLETCKDCRRIRGTIIEKLAIFQEDECDQKKESDEEAQMVRLLEEQCQELYLINETPVKKEDE